MEIELRLLMLFGSTLSFYFILKIISNYAKINLNKDILIIHRIVGSKTYDLKKLTSWYNITFIYTTQFRKITLHFSNKTETITDTVQPRKYENLYHYLRIHYSELNQIQ